MKAYIKHKELVSNKVVVDLATAKVNSNIEHDEQDDFLQLLLDAAIAEAEDYTNSAISLRDVEFGFDQFDNTLKLGYGPVSKVTELAYYDAIGTKQVLPDTDYELVQIENVPCVSFNRGVLPKTEPGRPFPVVIATEVGYDPVPPAIKQAIILIFSHNELYREDAKISLNRSSRVKLRPYKRIV